MADTQQEKAEKTAIVRAIMSFATRMIMKMFTKYDEGYRGWDNPADADLIEKKLRHNVDECKWVNVANLAMMLQDFQDRV